MKIISNNTSKATPNNYTKSGKMKYSAENRKRSNMMIDAPSSKAKNAQPPTRAKENAFPLHKTEMGFLLRKNTF
jgi:hypothetical protein